MAHTDLYARVTAQIVAALEADLRPWVQPWCAGHAAGAITRPLRAGGQSYHGINVVLLWLRALFAGYECPIWMTYRQAQERGGQVRRGEQGATVVYANTFTRRATDEQGEETEEQVPFLKAYTVFNAEQIDGLPGHFYALATPPLTVVERIEQAEAFIANTGARITHPAPMAYYSPLDDGIRMPAAEQFRSAESYYATLLHELTHWSGNASRLDRDLGRKRFGDEGYAMEELIAELGAAFLCADLGINTEAREDHAAYVGAWLKVLRNDKKAIFAAAAHAERAADYLHGLQHPSPGPQPQTLPAAEDGHAA
jgi:antirestriction protein ArdC